jgi:hypothetical protein
MDELVPNTINVSGIAAETLALANERAASGDLVLYMTDVLLHRHDAAWVPLRAAAHGGWTAEPQRCHDNVAHWVAIHPECSAVQGWLLMDMGLICRALGIPRFIDLLPHTVVKAGNGSLVDITPRHPLASSDVYPFIPNPGTDEEYAAFVDGRSICRVRIYVEESPPRFVYAPN